MDQHQEDSYWYWYWCWYLRTRTCLVSSMSRARCLVLSNGMAGAEKQAVALAERIGLPFEIRNVVLPTAVARLPTSLLCAAAGTGYFGSFVGSALASPHPQIAISCGRGSIAASVALREASGGHTLTVHVQRPECSSQWFDLVVVPRHDVADASSAPPNMILTDGSLHGVSESSLGGARREWQSVLRPLPAPRLAVLLGGTLSRRWWHKPLAPELTAASATALVRSAVAAIAAHDGSLLITTSRRTPPDACDAVANELEAASAAGVSCRLWTPDEAPNPYLGLLAWADQIVVSPDSINMVTEACATGKPVYVLTPEECSRRFAAFHERQLESGRTRAWPGHGGLEPSTEWSRADVHGPSDTARAAARVVEMLRDRHGDLAFSFSALDLDKRRGHPNSRTRLA